MKKYLAVVGGIAAATVFIYFILFPVFTGKIELSPTFHIGNFQFRYYGLIMGLAILSAYLVGRLNAWRFGLGEKEIDRFAFYAIIVAVISARLYFVVFEWDYYSQHLDEIWQIWLGGLSIFGALLGGLLFTYFYSRKKAYSIWQLLDLTAVVLPLGQVIGRFGNFFNYEAYGRATQLPWKMYVPEQYRYSELMTTQFYHPTFMYEVIANLIIFVALYSLRGKLKSGNLALIYLAAYGLLRFFIEPLRLDAQLFGVLRVNQIMAIVIFFIASAALVYRSTNHSQKT
jgi:phosphatidylglycerol:prolipoprotein diacylglycerol transferase